MITFVDGPAAGVELELRFAPPVLRVVFEAGLFAGDGKWDGLDASDDRPRPEEQIYVYELAGRPSCMFIDYHDGGRRRGAQVLEARYRHVPDPPADDVLRDPVRWRNYLEANYDRVKRLIRGKS